MIVGSNVSRAARFGRFNLVGIGGFVLQLMLLHLLVRRCGFPVAVATALAVEGAVLHNFAWHVCYTWREWRPRGAAMFLRALLLFQVGNGLISLLGNTLLTTCLVQRLQVPLLAANVVSVVLCSLLNFALGDRLVFTGSARVMSLHSAEENRNVGGESSPYAETQS